MSSRVLRKLQGDLAATLGVDGMSESDDGSSNHTSSGGAVRKQLASNRFELLNSVDYSLSDTEAKEDDDRENEPIQEGQEKNKLEKQDSTHSTDSLKRRKKKKKKKLKSQKSTEENLDDAEDEVEASIREVNKMLGEPEMPPNWVHHSSSAEKHPHEKSLLSVDLRFLNSDNEMKKMFGSKVVQNEQVKRKGRGRGHVRTTVLIPTRHWPHLGKPGFTMNLLETKDNVHYFAFEHGKQYQQIQVQFLEAVESFNPNNIVELLNNYPFHVDALIQFSDICKMGDDAQMAAELIERALYSMECCIHPLFNFTQNNCRLDYRRAENRSFYIAVFKHLTFVGQRGCSRTALEFCKLLLNLDPEGDPLCVTLMIDYYALRSAQYDFLIRLFYEWNDTHNLDQLPNFAFSVPLAMYLRAVEEGKITDEADEMLQNAVLMYPGVLLPLLDKCSVQPDADVASHPYFKKVNNPPALAQLQSLYIGRTFMIWKLPDTIFWLERNVKQALQRIKREDPYIQACQEKKSVRYKGTTPRNVLRHIILSNIKEANVTLPQELSNSPIFGFDPLPPTDSITSYTRPTRNNTSGDDRGMLSMFFRSLLPNFNVPREAVGGNRDGAATERNDTNDLRRSVTSLLDAMRDLLSNIHLADVPNEGDVDSDEDRNE